jgi:hypothetical protein
MNYELERILKETVVSSIGVLYWNLKWLKKTTENINMTDDPVEKTSRYPPEHRPIVLVIRPARYFHLQGGLRK